MGDFAEARSGEAGAYIAYQVENREDAAGEGGDRYQGTLGTFTAHVSQKAFTRTGEGLLLYPARKPADVVSVI